jgi:hypothetical protein
MQSPQPQELRACKPYGTRDLLTSNGKIASLQSAQADFGAARRPPPGAVSTARPWIRSPFYPFESAATNDGAYGVPTPVVSSQPPVAVSELS